MGIHTKDNGKITHHMDKVRKNLQMEISLLVLMWKEKKVDQIACIYGTIIPKLRNIMGASITLLREKEFLLKKMELRLKVFLILLKISLML